MDNPVTNLRSALVESGVDFTEEQLSVVVNAVSAMLSDDASLGSWSLVRKTMFAPEKAGLGKYFVRHDFLVPPGSSPNDRTRVASILVNQGTTPNAVLNEALRWIKNEWETYGPFDLTWFSPGRLAAGTLRHFRNQDSRLKSATNIFCFPGDLDAEREAVTGSYAVQFVEDLQMKLSLTYTFLGVNALDPDTGAFYFHFQDECPLQRACAGIKSSEKFIFLDSSKHRLIEGYIAYDLAYLMESTDRLTFYVSSSDYDEELHTKLLTLVADLMGKELSNKRIRLQLVGKKSSNNYDLTDEVHRQNSKVVSAPARLRR